jgi:hypothetical protein
MTTVTATKSGVTTISFPDAISSTTLSCPPESEVVFQTPRVTIELACSTETEYTMAFKCQSTKVVTFLGPSAAVVTAQCSLVTQFPTPPTTIPGTTTALTTTTPLPVWTTWPDAIIEPITTAVEKPRPVIDGVELPCKLWFFFVSLSKYLLKNEILLTTHSKALHQLGRYSHWRLALDTTTRHLPSVSSPHFDSLFLAY